MLPAIRWNFVIIKAMELAPIHLHDRLVISKVPLYYVIRNNIQPAPVEVQVVKMVNGEYYATTM